MNNIIETEATTYHKKFTKALIEISESNNYENAKLEWEIDMVEQGGGVCICTHKLTKERVWIKNIINQKQVIVGSCCCKRFELDSKANITKLVSKCHNTDIWCNKCDKKKRYNKKNNSYNCKCDLLLRDLVKHELIGEKELLNFGKNPNNSYKKTFDKSNNFDEWLKKNLYKIKNEHRKYIRWAKIYKELLSLQTDNKKT